RRFAVPEIHNDSEITQPRPSPVRYVLWQGKIRDLRRVDISSWVFELPGSIRKRRARDVVTGERIALLLNQRIAVSIRNDPVPAGWLASIGQFIEPCVVRIVSIRSTVRIDRHTGDKIEGSAVWQLSDRYLMKALLV